MSGRDDFIATLLQAALVAGTATAVFMYMARPAMGNPPPPPPPQPTLLLSHDTISLGQPVQIAGSHFPVGDSVAIAAFSDVTQQAYQVGTAVADASGNFGPLVYTPVTQGRIGFFAMATPSNAQAVVQLLVNPPASPPPPPPPPPLNPHVQVNISQGTVGSPVMIIGSGFIPGEVVPTTIFIATLGETDAVTPPPTADASGNVGPLVYTPRATGMHGVTLIGQQSQIPAIVQFNVS